MTIRKPMFSLEDAERAHEEWGANCGPGALAAIMGMTLDDVRPHMGDFESKRYTNPTLMNAALRSIGRGWKKVGAIWPRYGLVRVQWEGPWTEPGCPMRARYRFTHWIGAATVNGQIGVFDINCISNGSGWVSLEDWGAIVVPHLTALYPRASGKWHITHAIEVQTPSTRTDDDRARAAQAPGFSRGVVHISMCADDACPSRLRCYRYVAEHNPGRQRYIITRRLPGAERCGYFWEVDGDA